VASAIRLLRRPVIVVIHVCLAFTLFGLQHRPRPRVPCERRLSRDVFCGLERLGVGWVRIGG
jgi:hypothetical protein